MASSICNLRFSVAAILFAGETPFSARHIGTIDPECDLQAVVDGIVFYFARIIVIFVCMFLSYSCGFDFRCIRERQVSLRNVLRENPWAADSMHQYCSRRKQYFAKNCLRTLAFVPHFFRTFQEFHESSLRKNRRAQSSSCNPSRHCEECRGCGN